MDGKDIVDLDVRLTPRDAADILIIRIRGKTTNAGLVDEYVRICDGKVCMVLVFEKYYMRNQCKTSLTVTIDDLQDRTHIHAVGSGGGGNVMGFGPDDVSDWGAVASFLHEVNDIFSPHRL